MSRGRLAAATAAVGLALSLVAAQPAHAASDVALTALSVDARPITVDDHLTMSYTVQSTAALEWVTVAYTSPSGRLVGGQTGTQPGQTGTIRINFNDGIENGLYRLSFVEMKATGAIRHYGREGGPSGTGEHPFDFAAFDVTVSGSVYDVSAPQITAVDISPSSLRPGEPLTVTWTAMEQHQVSEMWFEFTNDIPRQPAGGEVVHVPLADLARGSTTKALLATAIDGRYTLSRILLADSLGNRAAYERDGSVTPLGGNQPGGTSHSLDFATVHFDVTGSTTDVAVPVLTSASVTPRPVGVGETVSLSYVVSDAQTNLATLAFHYASPDGQHTTALEQTTVPIAKSGRLETGLWTLGTWKLIRIDLMDTAGNDIQLFRDGTTHSGSGRFDGTHARSFSALDIVVESTMHIDRLRPRPRSAELAWSLPTWEANGVTGFRVSAAPGGWTQRVPATGDLDYHLIVPGLTNAVTYTISVAPEYGAELGAARRAAVTPLMSGNVHSAGDVNGDKRPDLLGHLPKWGDVRIYRGKGSATYGGGSTAAMYPDARTFPGTRISGHATFLALFENNALSAEHLASNGSALGGTPIGTGWGMRFLDGSADFTTDGKADIVAVTPGGTAYLYRGYGEAGYSKGARIATGWNSMQTLFAASDVTGDRRADLLGVDKDGVLWLFPGTGKGTFTAKRKVSSGWGGLGGLFYAADASGDGRGDLGAVTMGGTLRIYKGRGNGTFTSAVSVSSGWAAYL